MDIIIIHTEDFKEETAHVEASTYTYIVQSNQGTRVDISATLVDPSMLVHLILIDWYNGLQCTII